MGEYVECSKDTGNGACRLALGHKGVCTPNMEVIVSDKTLTDWQERMKKRGERAAAIDKLGAPKTFADLQRMTKQAALVEAVKRFGRQAQVWRLDAKRYVVGVMERVRLPNGDVKEKWHAAGSGASWEEAFKNDDENRETHLKEIAEKQKELEAIAEVCHEANRAWTRYAGDVPVQPPWAEAPEEMKESTRQGVTWRMQHPQAPAAAQHEAWRASKTADGWVHGEVKDPVKKTHPALVDYDQLPPNTRKKDYLFTSIVMSLGLWDAMFLEMKKEDEQKEKTPPEKPKLVTP